MNPKDLFLLSFEALVDRKVRTLLTILMVVLGSSLVVVLNGLSAGQAVFLEKQFNTLAANVLFVGSGQRGFRDASAGNAIIINTVIVSKIKSLPLVSDVIPEYTGSVTIDSQGNTQRVSVTSLDPTKLTVELPNLEYVDGSTVKANDRSSAIVGDTIVNPPGAANAFISLGQTIRATATYVDSSGKSVTVTKNFVVTGILKPSGNTGIDPSVIINL